MKFTRTILLFSLLVLLFASCSKEAEQRTPEEQAKLEKSLLPFSTGKIGGLYSYFDQSLSNSQLRDSLFYHLDVPYLITPNLSSAIDVNVYNFETFKSGGARSANNLMVVNIQEESSLANYVKAQLGQTQIQEALAGKEIAMVRVKDINATPQQIFYILVNGNPNLGSTENQQRIREFTSIIIEEATILDNERIVSSFKEKRTLSIETIIQEKFDFEMWIPRTYETVLNEDNFLWLVNETSELYSNIVVYKQQNDPKFTIEEQVLALRDEFGQKITTTRENSRMTTHVSSKPLPHQTELEIDGEKVVETRGLWRMINDRLGGGFVNYTFIKGEDLITIDGFVFYSDDDKRRKMRDIDAILSTVKLDIPSTNN